MFDRLSQVTPGDRVRLALSKHREDSTNIMSEFLDFLKHQYAYVAIGEFRPGKFTEAQQLFEAAVSTYKQGFEGAYLLQETNSDRGIAVIFWDNIDDMDANRNEACEAIFAKMAHLFLKPPVTNFYEVCSKIDPQPAERPLASV
jgi:heme-degrading monooxygenase HmoA